MMRRKTSSVSKVVLPQSGRFTMKPMKLLEGMKEDGFLLA
jgi:hypothetical protein